MNEDVKSTGVHIHSRADELIACLEGEIAKRDARIVELENAAESLRISRDYHHEQEVEYRRRWAGICAAPVSEAKAQGVVMPERKEFPELMMAEYHEVRGWNACLDEVARLNAAPAAPAADAGLVEALELAANRLDRLALEHGEFWRGYATAWADEARDTANGVKS